MRFNVAFPCNNLNVITESLSGFSLKPSATAIGEKVKKLESSVKN